MSTIEDGFPGYMSAELPHYEELVGTEHWSAEDWQREFFISRQRLISFIDARDPYLILARSAIRLLTERYQPQPKFRRLEQAEVEMIQTLLLSSEANVRNVPTSPSHFVRFWPLMGRHLHAFMKRQEVTKTTVSTSVSQRARWQTLYYRNSFTRANCEQVMDGILAKIDKPSCEALGYDLRALFRALSRLHDLVEDRLTHFRRHLADLLRSNKRAKIINAIDFFRSVYPLASRTWRNRTDHFTDIKQLRDAGFQLSELSYPWVFTHPARILEQEFDRPIVEALYGLSYRKGELSSAIAEHVYLNNPIWQKPYIQLENGDLFTPLPQIVFSFPFAIAERLMAPHAGLKTAYEHARSECLESEIAQLVAKAMPSAAVYRHVEWDDPDTGKTWENDVIAQLGNFLFVFEAKSGRIYDAARRGGGLSLQKNFKELFIEPGLQGWRLQNYIDQFRQSASFRLKRDRSRVDLQLDRPKLVYRFSVCFEHLAGLTSAKHHLKDLGLIENEIAWAPVLSLGELQMIARYIDAEPAFQHYLTRRATLEEVLDFDGDEQDLLSMYLTNGLWFDASVLDGRRLSFWEADSFARLPKVPRANNAVFASPGVQLSPLWKAICKELYQNKNQRHRFDILNVILNQPPHVLMEFERRIRRFRRGVPNDGEDMLIVHQPLGSRAFVVGCHLAKRMPDTQEWQEKGRGLVEMFLGKSPSVDCATFVFARRSRRTTIDGVSFYRYGFDPQKRGAIDQ